MNFTKIKALSDVLRRMALAEEEERDNGSESHRAMLSLSRRGIVAPNMKHY